MTKPKSHVTRLRAVRNKTKRVRNYNEIDEDVHNEVEETVKSTLNTILVSPNIKNNIIPCERYGKARFKP